MLLGILQYGSFGAQNYVPDVVPSKIIVPVG